MRNTKKWLKLPLVILLILPIHSFSQAVTAPVAMHHPQPERSAQPAFKKSLKEALRDLKRQFNVKFIFETEIIQDKTVSTDVFEGETNLNNVLDKLSSQIDLRFKKIGEQSYIILKRDKPVEKITTAASDMTRSSFAQRRVASLEQTISGQVIDQSTNEPLPGVNILAKGTTTGTVTDVEGNYRITVDDAITTLVFSSIGYTTEEVAINGRTTIDLSLAPDIQSLSEVVVTAFGIEREKKALSYAVQEVDGEKLAAVGNTNLENSLQGKVAGVTVRQTSGAPGSGTRINIRGSRSFRGNNEPLYVVDGLPIASGGDSRSIDINPSDIKSINVLKGPTAAALYGLRASNGVVIIETKNGEATPGGTPTVTLESNYSAERLSMFPDTQTTYGQGENGEFNVFSPFSWGPRIDTLGAYTNQLGEPEQAAVYDNDKELFRTGGILNTNLTVSNAFAQGNYAVSLGYTDQKGILPNSGMQRINTKFAGSYHLSDQFTVGTSINYTNNIVEQVGDVPWWGTFSVPPTYNLRGKPTHEPGNRFQQINFRGQHDNLYWALENNYADTRTSRTFGNINFDYNPFDWLSVNYRVGLDEFTTDRKAVEELGSQAGRTDPPSGGTINNRIEHHRQINSNLNLRASKTIGEEFDIELMVGNELYDIRRNQVVSNGTDIIVGGFHNVSNTAVQITSEELNRRRVVGFFGDLSLSWRNSVFLNATGRNDIVSNMPRENRSFFYPSLGTSVVFTEFFSIPESILTFGKVRASVAEVGQAGPIYATEVVFEPGTATGGFVFPYEGLNAFTLGNRLNAADLRPENTRTFEAGINLRFLNDRIGVDYTYYNTVSEGQIYAVPIARSTGFASELRNAGEMNVRGHEIALNATPVVTPTVRWDLITNFTTYTNTVVSLAEGIEQLELGGSRVTAVARVGEEFPAILGDGYARDPATGQVVVDSRATLPNGRDNRFYGMPLRSTEEIILGNALPDFEIGFINTVSIKNFTFYAQLDWRQGGKVFSGYNRLGKLYGVLSETENREGDYVFPGQKGFYDEDGNVVVEGNNDIVIQPGFNFYRRNQDRIEESSVYDATYVRLRELRLTYDFPAAWLGNSFIDRVSFYLIGRNLWVNAALPHFDPEMFSNNAVEEYTTYPQTKSYGGGFRVTF